MPHSRARHIHPLLKKSLKWSPSVGIVGLRQVGKTTLVQHVTEEFGGDYVTLDHESELNLAEQRTREFLTRRHLLCIDEVQRAPGLFPQIKDLIGTQRKPARFLLTGSVRFTLKSEIKESLTGRIIIHELLPFTVAEAHKKKPSGFLQSLFNLHETLGPDLKNFRSRFENLIQQFHPTDPAQLTKHILHGGLPIPCFARDASQRKSWFQFYLETLITRDLALFDPRLRGIIYRQGIAALYELARQQQMELNMTHLMSVSGLSRAMIHLFLSALEALCLIDFIPSWQQRTNAIKKLRVEWKDTGLWSSLMQIPETQIPHHAIALNLLLSTELRSQLQFFPDPVLWHGYRHRNGASIPWIFTKGQSTFALSHLPIEAPSQYDLNSLRSFLRIKDKSFAVMLTSEKAKPTLIERNLFSLPYNLVF